MTIKMWLDTAIQDAERRNLPELRSLLETLARSTAALRSAEWNDDATGAFEGPKDPPSLFKLRRGLAEALAEAEPDAR